ncbi:hypothetical protein Dsin_025456 [Dipteronia sinensis]|uniref:RNase H type-1 domain-containing protein n=1 Tax=Dipteronia sinensis TaxID=43782 RepID=A0AAE0DX52_9ROSI|nr:hypothetical protein Dsin_025456 [Dipteronia sinensis]
MLGDESIVDILKLQDGSWNDELVRHSFSEEETDAILGLPSSKFVLDESLLWNFDKSRSYSVRSAFDSEMGGASCWNLQNQYGCFKINTNTTLNSHDKITGIGMVIRNSNGHVMASLCQIVKAYFHL